MSEAVYLGIACGTRSVAQARGQVFICDLPLKWQIAHLRLQDTCRVCATDRWYPVSMVQDTMTSCNGDTHRLCYHYRMPLQQLLMCKNVLLQHYSTCFPILCSSNQQSRATILLPGVATHNEQQSACRPRLQDAYAAVTSGDAKLPVKLSSQFELTTVMLQQQQQQHKR